MQAIWPGEDGVAHACLTPGWPAAMRGGRTKLALAARAGTLVGRAGLRLADRADAAVAAGAVTADATRPHNPAPASALASRARLPG
jgi:hypothetical protein